MAVLEEENPHVYGERWFRRTGSERPRNSVPAASMPFAADMPFAAGCRVGKGHQKGAKNLP
jgi:hypothetical protein